MKKWEILVIDLTGDTEAEMRALGKIADNWELVSVVSLPLCRRAYLKRPIPEQQTPEAKHSLADAGDGSDLIPLRGTIE